MTRHLTVLVATIVSAWLMLAGLEEKSPTEDEWAHMVRGMQHWNGGDTRLQYAHPPLGNALTALPLAFDDDLPDFTELDGWKVATVGRVALAYLNRGYSDARRKLMRARLVSIGLAIFGMLYAYGWALRVFGPRVAVTLAVMLAFHPTLLGQARYVSTDVPCAVACLIATGELARHLRGNAPGATWLGTPLGLVAAVLSKHSGLLLIPLFASVTLAVALAGRGRFQSRPLARRLGAWGAYVAWLGLLVLLAVNVAYDFEGSGMRVADILARPEPQYWISERFEGGLLETTSPLEKLPADMRVPLPYTWMFGVSALRVQSAWGYPWGSFLGQPNTTGHVAFFPLLTLLKTPGVLIVTGLTAAWAVLRTRTIRLELAVVGSIGLGFLLIAMTSRMNMGVRHVLPVLYLSAIWSAVGAVWLCERLRGRAGAQIVWWCATLLLASRAYGSRADFLGYFNIGRTLGHQVSVVGEDVGQDRYRFAQMVKKRRLHPMFYDSQTATRAREASWAGLRYFELDCHTRIPGGAYAAIHASRRPLIGEECLPQLSEIRPLFTFGDHVDVYRLP